jgi:hypothetical protein
MPVPPASFGGPPPRSVRLSVVRPSIERWEELRASAARLNMQPATASFQPPITPSILGLPPSYAPSQPLVHLDACVWNRSVSTHLG